ncbi:MAG: DUF2156 domain-containing protein [Candidatus Omnitrophica bacterium]|nr:DUF2156 domain-containing protein [Candidatus Omnitrophota bacterium]
MSLPQGVSSDFCLQCRGCCVFGASTGDWCARLMVEEEIALEKSVPGFSFGGYVLTKPYHDGRLACRCLNADDHRCRVYSQRPLECRLYPFLLSSEKDKLKLYVHRACPWVQERRHAPQWLEDIAGVTRFLGLPANHFLLKAVVAAFPDYSRYGDEIELVAEIPFENNADLLWQRKAELNSWFGRREPVLSSRSFVNAIAWSDAFDFTVEEADGNLLLYARQQGIEFLYCPPLGDQISPRAVEAAFSRMQGGAARIEAVALNELTSFDSVRYRAHLQGEEYYYERARVAALSGNGYRSKRSDINAFLKKYAPVFRPFLATDRQACLDLFDRWLDNRRTSYEDDIYRAMLVENRPVHRRLMEHADALGLTGRVVEIDGVIVGYTFGYRLSDDTFCVALEVTLPELKGLPSYIFREFCADASLGSFKFINAMDDFGMPGVARAKRSWRPSHMEKVYSVCLTP